MSADVSNYPGTTVDIAQGKVGVYELIDTPGAYGVSSFNDEEKAARRLILEADIIVNVVSALSLDRDLFLSLQLIDMQKPLLVVINQFDEALERKIKIDTDLLSDLLGVPVMTCVAVRRQGIEQIIDNLDAACPGKTDAAIAEFVEPFCRGGVNWALALLIAEGDEASATAAGVAAGGYRADIYRARRQKANAIVAQTVVQDASRQSLSLRLGRFLLHPTYGFLIAAAVCYLIFYQLLGVLIAGNLVDLTEKKGMRVYFEPAVRRITACAFPCTVTANNRQFEFPQGTLAANAKAQEFDRAAARVAFDSVNYNFFASRHYGIHRL